jgi:hypothetical protein
MLLGVVLLAAFALVAWLLVAFIKTLYAGRPVDRIWVILGGYMGACTGAAVAVSLIFFMRGILDAPISSVLSGVLVTIIMLPVMIPFVTGFIAVYALLPAGLIITCAELAGLRSPLFYGPAGVTAAALTYFFFDVSELLPLPAGAIGGLAGGLTYWGITGRGAGQASFTPAIRNDEKPPAD